MATSVLIEFEATFPKTEFDRIYNADFLANELTNFLDSKEINVPSNDLWKDSGWFHT